MKKTILIGASLCVMLTACSPFSPVNRDVHAYLNDFNPLVDIQNQYTQKLKSGFMDIADPAASEKALDVLTKDLQAITNEAEGIHPKTKEVQRVHAHYVKGLHLQEKGLDTYKEAFQAKTDRNEEELIVKADEYMAQADQEFAAHEKEMKKVAEQHDVSIDFK